MNPLKMIADRAMTEGANRATFASLFWFERSIRLYGLEKALEALRAAIAVKDDSKIPAGFLSKPELTIESMYACARHMADGIDRGSMTDDGGSCDCGSCDKDTE